MTLEEIQTRLCAAPWNAGLDYFDLLQSLLFRTDGTGEFVYGYGQAIRDIITFRYELVDEQHLRIEADATDDCISGIIRFELHDGTWTFAASDRRYYQQLILRDDPFAAAYEAGAVEPMYYAFASYGPAPE